MSEENVSLPVAQALASALAKIEAYVPTEYVDNSEPDLDAEHLNHAEQGIMRVTNLLNAAVDVIQGQESRLADAETKIGTAALAGGMTDLSSGLNAVNSNLAGFRIDLTWHDNIDFNNIQGNCVIAIGDNSLNAPTYSPYSFLIQLQTANRDTIRQIVFCTSAITWIRCLQISTWGEWKRLDN